MQVYASGVELRSIRTNSSSIVPAFNEWRDWWEVWWEVWALLLLGVAHASLVRDCRKLQILIAAAHH
jgi:hypothetical protein